MMSSAQEASSSSQKLTYNCHPQRTQRQRRGECPGLLATCSPGNALRLGRGLAVGEGWFGLARGTSGLSDGLGDNELMDLGLG